MEVIDIQAVKDCLAEVSDCEDKQYAIALLEWAIGKRTFDLDEHDNQIRAEVITRIKKSVKNALNSYNPSYIDIYNVISELSDVVIGRIEIFEEQLKGTENDNG